MSTTPGKILIDGVTSIHGEEVFVLRFIQARNPEWVRRPFLAKYDPTATWIDDLEPALGEDKFFFEDGSYDLESPGELDLLSRAEGVSFGP